MQRMTTWMRRGVILGAAFATGAAASGLLYFAVLKEEDPLSLDAPPGRAVISVPRPLFEGRARADEIVRVTLELFPGGSRKGGSAVLIPASLDDDGSFSARAPESLPSGAYTIRAVARDENNAVVATTERSFVRWQLGAAGDGGVAGSAEGGTTFGVPGVLRRNAASAVAFDGVNDHIVVDDRPSLDMTDGVTIEAWVRREKGGEWQVVAGKPGDGQSAHENYALWINPEDQAEAFFGDGTAFVSVTTPPLDRRWHQIVATYGDAGARIYLDGVLAESAPARITLKPNDLPLNVGRANNATYFFGGAVEELVVSPQPYAPSLVRERYMRAQVPPAVTLTSPAVGSRTSDQTPAVAGMAGATARDARRVVVTLWSGRTAEGPPIASFAARRFRSGAWGGDVPNRLSAGLYTARAEQRSGGGLRGRSRPVTFEVSTQTAPGGALLLGAGDIADCSSEGDEATARLLERFPNATVFTLGDNVYDQGRPDEFARCYEPSWGRVRTRTNPTPGDHDYADGADPRARGYFQYFRSVLTRFGPSAADPTRGYYSFDVGAWHVVALNTACRLANSNCSRKQLRWLRTDLASEDGGCTAVLMHAPRFSSGSVHGGDRRWVPYWQVFHEGGVELVVSGDDHHYERFAPQDPLGAFDPEGVRQFVVGTGGGSLYPFGAVQPNSEVRHNDTFGVLKLVLRRSGYEWEFIPAERAGFQDSGSSACR